MTRREAIAAEKRALESLKVAAIDYARESSGGPEPLRAGAMLRLAAKAYHSAAHGVVDAILDETREERGQYEGPVSPGARRPSVMRRPRPGSGPESA